MCRSMVDIQSVATEIRRGKKDRREIDRKILQGKNRAAIARKHSQTSNLHKRHLLLLLSAFIKRIFADATNVLLFRV